MRDFHYGIYIGRFQPLHIGHEQVIRNALERVETLIIIVGSSDMARTPVNPFLYDERAAMIRPTDATIVSAPRCTVAVDRLGAHAEAMSTALLVADEDRAERLLNGDRTRRFLFDFPRGAAIPINQPG